MIIDSKSINDLNQLEGTIWADHDTMKLTFQNYDFDLKGEIIVKMKTGNAIKSNNCDQCDFTSSQAGNLRTHLKTHNGEK